MKFYVGQRVRILWSRGWPELSGQTGRIVGRCATSGLRGTSEWQVAPDWWGSPEAPYPSNMGDSNFGPCSDQLEPILDPGREVISWADMADLWTPDKAEA